MITQDVECKHDNGVRTVVITGVTRCIPRDKGEEGDSPFVLDAVKVRMTDSAVQNLQSNVVISVGSVIINKGSITKLFY